MDMRVAMGDIIHESNTFHPVRTELDAFVTGSDITKVMGGRSDEVLQVFPKNVEVIPTFYARAIPSGPVAKNACLSMKEEILRPLQTADKIDGVYLHLHSSMEVEGIGDGERDLLKSVRDVVGEESLISVSLDLHGNISLDLDQEFSWEPPSM